MGTDNEPGNNNPEPLLQRTANLASDPAVSGPARIKTLDPHGDERLDMLGQLRDAPGTARPRELAEGNQQRHPHVNTSRRITTLSEPVHVPLDLGADPRRSDV